MDVEDPEYLTQTSCTNTEYKTKRYCYKDCHSCSGEESGPIGCLRLSGIASILRTCGPAPQVLYGRTWLLEYKSADGNCSGSVLKSGVVADECFPTAITDAKQVQCTE